MSVRNRVQSIATTRTVALVSVATLLGASLQVLYHFVDVTGGPWTFLGVVLGTVVAATALSRVLKPWLAVFLGVVLLGAGLAWYLGQVTGNPPLPSLIRDTIALFFGRSLLHITGIRAWVFGVAPAPIFLTWYFAMRRNYVGAVLVAGGTLAFFVLTTDADAVTTLTGVVAATGALALGDMDRRDEPVVRADAVLTVIAVMILVPAVLSVIPAGAGAPVSVTEELLGEDGTLEESLMTDERIGIEGSITLSPEVRFSVTSDAESYWRVASYDRYTGDGWVRTGTLRPSDGSLAPPEGASRSIEQTYRAETEIQRMPGAWKPVQVSRFDGDLRESADGSIQPASPLNEGETYSVRSQVPSVPADRLQTAGTDYPRTIRERYTQLPSSTPDRVAERTATLTANADTPYETALTVERWLQNNREYSLSVTRPRGDVADAFLFEMEQGYCTYYATTMVTMLRSQDIPARFVTGYTAGERVSEDEWVVRGLNSHAWVEVYFPGQGWQRFDPTPGGPREAARTSSVDDARARGQPYVDNSQTRDQIEDGEWTPEPAETAPPLTEPPDGNASDDPNSTVPAPGPRGELADPAIMGNQSEAGGEDGDGSGWIRRPTRQQFTLGLVALAGVAIGLRRTRPVRRTYRAVWLRYQPRTDPATDVERAFQRVLHHVQGTAQRRREPGETVRAYFDAVDADPDARRVAQLRERARYAGEVTEADADEAVGLANGLIR